MIDYNFINIILFAIRAGAFVRLPFFVFGEFMTSVQLAGLAGILLSVVFEYVPGLSVWYEQQENVTKRLVMLGALLVACVGVFVLSCHSPFVWVECSNGGVWELVQAFTTAVVTNQITHKVGKKT